MCIRVEGEETDKNNDEQTAVDTNGGAGRGVPTGGAGG